MPRVLIVDDNAPNLYLLNVLLETNGFTVDQASNGVEALESARKNIPDLLITDILMPTMDGFSLCRIWKSDDVLRNVPLVFYTATYTEQKDEEFALSLGAEKFVKKPQTPDDLLAIIKEVLAHKNTSIPEKDLNRPIPKEDEFYKGYNEALVRKLEKKMLQLEKSNNRLNSFYQVSCDLVTIKTSKEIINKVLNAIHEIIGYQKIIYFLYDNEKKSLTISETRGFPKKICDKIQEKLNNPSSGSETLVGMTANTRQILNIKDVSKEEKWTRLDDSLKSVLYIPVQYEQVLLGVLGLYSTETDAFSEDEKNIASLTNSLAISIINKQTEEKIIQLNLELEDRIQERTTQLQHSNQDLEAFAYSISHDLRAPLRAIEGYSTILIDEYKKQLDAEGVRILKLVCQNSQRMDTFITDLLSLSRVSTSEKKYSEINMSEIVADVINVISGSEGGTKTRFEFSALPNVFADPTLIRQVWDNLILNAIKYSRLKEKPSIRITGEVHEDEDIFMVEDNGIGFSQINAQNLFQPFQRLYSGDEYEGTGVGLTIVKRIIERHGGRVWAEGEQDQGAKFYFSIPRRAEKPG